MPLRTAPFRAAAHLIAAADSRTRPTPAAFSCFFHSSPVLRRDDIDSKNHYETLGVQTSASPKDIKRSFYHLSKTHHPDHNRDDPLASKRFMRISEAYSVLSNTDRRAKYDRDVLRLHDQRAAAAAGPHHRGASYSSTGPAGGRPASGLSRRRGTFRGPPPSFYRSGGWGAHGAKRSQAQEDSMSGSAHHDAHHHHHHHHQHHQHQHQHQHQQSPSGAKGFGSGGAGPEHDSFGGGGGSGEMPHFDRTAKAAHTRTQGRVDEIRARKAAKKPGFPSASGDYGEVGSFFAVLAVLGVAVGLPYLVMRGWNRPDKKQKKPQA